MSDIYKVTRVLVYTGPLEWLKETLDRNAVKGMRPISRYTSIEETSVSKPELVRPATEAELTELAVQALHKLGGEGLAEIERRFFTLEDL